MSTLLPGYNEASGLIFYLNDDGSKVTLNKTSSHTAVVTLNIEQSSVVNITQDGLAITQKVNTGGSTTINIIQK